MNDAPLQRIGDRVRAARARADMPRRVLSEVSGVSPRYLAQLEAGSGNISVGLLDRIAKALGLSLEELVMENDPWDGDAARLRAALIRATPEARARALTALENGAGTTGRICLIGLRGAGKSTLGRMAAETLGLPFVELTAEIEASIGMPLSEVLALYGQDGYREIEGRVLDEVAARDGPHLLAVAGGIVADNATFDRLLARYRTIWLRATPEDHMARVRAQGDMRPMAGNPAAMDQLRALLAARAPQYARAEAEMDSSGVTVDQAAERLTGLIRAAGMV